MSELAMTAGHWLPLLAQAVPQLPASSAMAVARHLGWALCLAAFVDHYARALLRRWPALEPRGRVVRRTAVALVALACLVPGHAGLTPWLGLAFQTPSFTAMALAAALLLGREPLRGSRRDLLGLCALVALLGWLLLLDTLAVLPLPRGWHSLYALGYGPAVVWLTLALAVGLIARGGRVSAGAGAALLVAAALHTVTRLPSGNAWDALLDPWLWLLAQDTLLRQAVAAWRARRVA